jgi:hypothetical protein
MITLEIFDPPICCATGVCGPDPVPGLPQFAADLEWLADRGVGISRDRVAACGRYPTRRALAGFAGLTLEADPA